MLCLAQENCDELARLVHFRLRTGVLVDSEVLSCRCPVDVPGVRNGIELGLDQALDLFPGPKHGLPCLNIIRALGQAIPEQFSGELEGRGPMRPFLSALSPIDGVGVVPGGTANPALCRVVERTSSGFPSRLR